MTILVTIGVLPQLQMRITEHAVPLHFQAPNRLVGAQHAVPAYTRPKRQRIGEMMH